jgi:hypothetical protein
MADLPPSATDLPERQTFRFHRASLLSLWLISIALTAVEVSLLRHPDPRHPALMDWLGLILFGLGCFLFPLYLIAPGIGLLELTKEGFRVTTLSYKSYTPWSATENIRAQRMSFSALRIWMPTFVAIDYVPSYSGELARLRRFNRSEFGASGAILPQLFGLNAQMLAALMNRYRDRALRSADVTAPRERTD